MAEKMAEQIAEILKEPNFQTAEKALTDFCGPMDGEFRNLLVDIIVERWIDTPKDVPFSYARSIWNRKDINREEYQALLDAGGNPKLSHRTDQQGKDIGFFMGCGK